MFHLGIVPTRLNRVKMDWLDALIGGGFGLVNSAINNVWSLENSKAMADYNKEISKELADYGFELDKKSLDYSKQVRDQSVIETPYLNRTGLVAAGYNPILAVNSSAGAPFSQQMSPSVPSGGGSSPQFTPSKLDVLGMMREASAIRQTEAQTELLQKRTLGEGWQVKTLTRSEAEGLGGNLLGKLGFNLHDSSQTTFLIAYNPITGELRNLGDTRHGIGSTEPSSASDVPDPHVVIEDESGNKSVYRDPSWRGESLTDLIGRE